MPLVLFRILAYDYPREDAERYYNRTLWYFITGICLAFLGVFIDTSPMLFFS